MTEASDDPKRAVISIVQVLASAEVGGAESVVRALASGLSQRGHALSVIAVLDLEPTPHPFERSLARVALPVTSIRLPPRAYLQERRELSKHFVRIRPDVVHTHGYRADIQAGSVARQLRIPTLSTVHGFVGGDWKNRLYERLQTRTLRRFDAVVAVAPSLQDRLRSGGIPPNRLHLIPNAWSGAGKLLSRDEARRELGLPERALVVGWVGRVSHEKGADVLLDAITEPAALPYEACFIGDGPERASLEIRASGRGINDRVHWVGIREEAARLFPAFDAFVLSSRTEGTPIALLEAMAAGIPIVATRVGGVPSVVAENEAWLVDPDDPEAIARALDFIRSHPLEARRRSAAGKRRLEEAFSFEPWVERYENLCRSLISRADPVGTQI